MESIALRKSELNKKRRAAGARVASRCAAPMLRETCWFLATESAAESVFPLESPCSCGHKVGGGGGAGGGGCEVEEGSAG
jgi:hypothetical protein